MSVRLSLAWSYIAQGICFAISFASTIVLARLVSPRDFGIVAMAAAATTIINVLMQFGLAKYIVSARTLENDDLRSLFTVNVLISLAYSLAIATVGTTSALYLDSREVGEFLLICAIFPVLAMFEFLPAALCARDMRFGVAAVIAVLRAIVMASTTIALALEGYGYMSFAWAQVLSWLCTATAYNIVLWRPDLLKPRFKGIVAIFRFGFQMIGISGLNQLSNRGSEIVLGSLMGLASLGVYNRASALPVQIYMNVYGAGSSVLFSRMSLELRETGTFHQTYIRFIRLTFALLWPILIGLAVLAQPIIYILYGAKWEPAAVPLMFLSLSYAILIALGMTSEVFILREQTGRQVRIEGVRALLGFILFSVGSSISVTFAAAAKVLEGLISLFLYRKPMSQLIGAPEHELRMAYSESALLTCVAVLPATVLMVWKNWAPTTSLTWVAAAAGLGFVLWACLLIHRDHPLFIELRRLLVR